MEVNNFYGTSFHYRPYRFPWFDRIFMLFIAILLIILRSAVVNNLDRVPFS